MDLNLAAKHALVCGGSEGIGGAAAIELAQLGADVTVLARRAEARLQGRGRTRCRDTRHAANTAFWWPTSPPPIALGGDGRCARH